VKLDNEGQIQALEELLVCDDDPDVMKGRGGCKLRLVKAVEESWGKCSGVRQMPGMNWGQIQVQKVRLRLTGCDAGDAARNSRNGL
jgi:hypothetical protein